MKALMLMFTSMLLFGCENAEQSTRQVNANSQAELADSKHGAFSQNQLSMLIDGVEWRFDNELMGGINPISDQPEILISGSRGPNDASEQTFTVIIRGASQPGIYRIKSGDGSQSSFQISGISSEEFLAGNMMPYDLTVSVTEVAENPMRLSASFQGSIDTNTGRTLQITEGKFSYQE